MPQDDPQCPRHAFWLIAFLLVPVLLMGGGALLAGTRLPEVRTAYQHDTIERGKEPASCWPSPFG